MLNERIKGRLSRVLLIFGAILVVGLLTDAFSGFPVIRHASSVIGGIGALLVVGALYLFSEYVAGRVAEIDKVEHPWWRRAVNLVVLLLTAALIAGAFYYARRYI